MKITTAFPAILGAIIALASTSVLADHNSVLGPGTANMPNDIHNAQIEDTAIVDGVEVAIEDWTDFVSRGAGADTVNRYDVDSVDITSVTSMRPSSGASIERPTVASRGGRR